MESAKTIVSEILYHLNLADLVKKDYDDIIDHGELVGKIVELLCRQMKLEDAFRELVVRAAYVHDIGKLRLGKNLYGRDKHALEIESVKYMRMHTKLGMEMLRECGWQEEIVLAVYHHHENYDGSGYPDNLAGESIPLSARMLRVCDAFSALISDRPYRRGFDMDAAVELMIEDNKTLDMHLFLEFLKLYHSEEFKEVAELAQRINAKQRYYEERG